MKTRTVITTEKHEVWTIRSSGPPTTDEPAGVAGSANPLIHLLKQVEDMDASHVAQQDHSPEEPKTPNGE